ncbi:hypothetical protein PUN28_015366 [Cardiocondyla obscurior]|uniref:Uncharacterized protein n=1 Tax=Cardiocondyla obscurior TaxID=286306 RepID=A0AAW2ESM3_9HYME
MSRDSVFRLGKDKISFRRSVRIWLVLITSDPFRVKLCRVEHHFETGQSFGQEIPPATSFLSPINSLCYCDGTISRQGDERSRRRCPGALRTVTRILMSISDPVRCI